MTALLESMGSFSETWAQRVRRLVPGGSGGGPLNRQTLPLNLARGLTLLALVAFAAWIVAGLVWDVTVPSPTGSGAAVSASGPTAGPTTSGAGQSGAQLSFFGVGAQADAPVSSGPYTLSGVMLSSDASQSRAIIRADQADHVYAVGDKLPNGQTIAAIEADRVIVETSAGREALPLPKPELGGSVPGDLNAGAAAAPAPAAQDDAALAALRAPATIDSSLLNPETLADQLGRVRTSMVAGGSGGIKLVDIGNSPILRSMGLRPGDVISSVNGQQITPEQSLAAILATVAGSPTANVVIVRNGIVTRKTVSIIGK